MRGDDRQRELAGERDGRGDQRVVVGMARTLHFEVVAPGKQRAPIARRGLRRAAGVALQQRVADVAVARAGQRDQAVGAFGEPFAPQLRAAAVLVGAIRARQPVGEPAGSRRATGASSSARNGASRSVSCVIQTSQPTIGLTPARARRLVELDQAEGVGEVGERQRGHAVARPPRPRASSMRTVPSTIEYSLCSRRWTKTGRAMSGAVLRMVEFYSASVPSIFVRPLAACVAPRATSRTLLALVLAAAGLLAGCATSRRRRHRRRSAAGHSRRRRPAVAGEASRAAARRDVNLQGFPLDLSAGLRRRLRERARLRAQGRGALQRRRQLPHRLAGRHRAVQEEMRCARARSAMRPSRSA